MRWLLNLAPLVFLMSQACSNESTQNRPGSSLSASTATPVSQVLFDSTKHCQANPLANYWKCKGPVVKIRPQSLSATALPSLKALGATNTLKYAFKCKSSQPLVASIKGVGGLSFNLVVASSESDEMHATAPVTLNPARDSYEVQVYDPDPNGVTIATAACSFQLFTNTSLPPLEAIKVILEQMTGSLRSMVDVYVKVSDPATDLDAEISMKQGLILIRQELAGLVDSYVALPATSADDRQFYCKKISDAWSVGGEIDEFGDVALLASYDSATRTRITDSCLKVQGILKEGSMVSAYRTLKQCLAGGTSDCTNPVSHGKDALAHSIESQKTAIEGVLGFLGAEHTRLQALVASLSTQIQNLINSIRQEVQNA